MPLATRPLVMSVAAVLVSSLALAQPAGVPGGPPLDWRTLEVDTLSGQTQLTFPTEFHKAGEQYFDPSMNWLVFQAVPVPPAGQEPDPHYSMYVAKLVKDSTGSIVGLERAILLSEPDSSNTCGWFHPSEPWRVMFASTVTPPKAEEQPGYQRGTSKYVWQFPNEMEIVETTVRQIWDEAHDHDWMSPDRPAPTELATTPVIERPNGYDAECSYSPDGRHILFAALIDASTKDLDLFVYDTETEETTKIVEAPGYDGGPFFSPDGTRICYRSDRAGNDLLQVFVADLAFDDDGAITGIVRETQLTSNEHVNWAPYWHPSGDFLIYATSEVGHHNYEVFAIEVPPAGSSADASDLKKKRITHASGFDGLPVFSDDGEWMVWTSQRGAKLEGQEKATSQVWVAQVEDVKPE
jgi:hypothetical protein